MNEIKKIKPIELVKKLDRWIDAGNETYQTDFVPYILEEELWTVESGIYRPLGKIQLPLLAAVHDHKEGEGYLYGVLSIFTNTFFENPESAPFSINDFNNDYEGIWYLFESITHQITSNKKSLVQLIESSGKSNEVKPFDVVMQRHIPEFIKLYDQTKGPATTESQQCIRKAFVDYRK